MAEQVPEDRTTAWDTNNPDYDTDVSKTIEQGTRYHGPVTSYMGWRKDAYLMYNRPDVTIEKLVAMRRQDGQARALGNLVTLPIRLALQQGRWVAPETGDAEEEVDFANLMWTLPPQSGGMTTSSHDLIPQILLALFDGFAPFELVSQIPTSGPLKGKLTLRKMAYRDPRTVTLLQDANGGYAGFRQIAHTPSGTVDCTLSPKKTALFTVNGHENPLYGISFFESAYPHYESKMKWYYISEMAGQFAAVPGRIGTVPPTAKREDVYAFRQALENFYFNTSMIKKQGFEVDQFNSVAGFDFMKYIDHHNFMMSKSVLATFFESQQRTVLVENSTQDASADLFLLSMETLANSLASVLTHYVMPKYIDANFTSGKYPVFKPGPLSDNAKKQIMDLFRLIAVSGILNITPEMSRELEKMTARDLGIDVDYDLIEEREQEAAVQQAEQAEMLAAQAQMESIEEERAAEGALPNNPMPTSGPSSQADINPHAQENYQSGGLAEDVAASTVSLSRADYQRSLDALYAVAQDVMSSGFSPQNYPVDKGLDGTE